MRIAKPNKTHYSIAAAQRLGYVPNYITQNVDNLHHSATPSPSLAASTILELHGTLSNVVCVSSPSSRPRHSNDPHSPSLFSKMNTSSIASLDPGSRLPAKPVPYNTPTGEAYPHGCGFRGLRNVFQDELTRLNPPWEDLASEMSRTGKEPKRNPDGDVDLGSSTDYSTFNYPNCPKCDGILKPSVIFFGESVPNSLRDRSFQLIEESNNFLLVGTSLATYSAFRLVKSGIEKGKEILLINKGPTRGDGIIGDENRIGLGSSEVLGEALKMLSGGKEEKDPVLKSLLEGGREKVAPKHAVVSS